MMEKKLTNSGPLMEPTDKHSIYTLDLCKAEVISVKVTAPPGDPFAALHPAKVLGAVELKNGAFSFSRPVPAP
jgi:hypothetical protein